jgi:hypothetical protein
MEGGEEIERGDEELESVHEGIEKRQLVGEGDSG